MSAISRLGPALARSSAYFHYPSRHMATSVAANEPVQKLFLDKIREFKANNQGLDGAHEKLMKEEMLRLKRIYKVEDESKLAHIEHKFPTEHDVSLRDIDENKELRRKIASGEFQKELAAQPAKPSALIASIPEQFTDEFHLPKIDKPDILLILDDKAKMHAPRIAEPRPSHEFIGDKMTTERLERELNVRFGPNMPTIHDDAAPERDTVNYPRLERPLDCPPTRYHFIPESWFQFFYPKTGVTGPYAFAGAMTTFLFSKEWLVMEHEMLTGFTTTIIFTYAVIKFGPKVRAYIYKRTKDYGDGFESWRTGTIDTLNTLEAQYKNQLGENLFEEIYNIRQQDVDLQLEVEYRNRLREVYTDTKRRLDYLVSVANSQRDIAQKNLVNWVISNATASFGPKQETEALDNCIVTLKQLANKHANAI